MNGLIQEHVVALHHGHVVPCGQVALYIIDDDLRPAYVLLGPRQLAGAEKKTDGNHERHRASIVPSAQHGLLPAVKLIILSMRHSYIMTGGRSIRGENVLRRRWSPSIAAGAGLLVHPGQAQARTAVVLLRASYFTRRSRSA